MRGHVKQIKLLQNAVRSGRVAHAYLFSGPNGIGKKLAAIELAATLNCKNNEDRSCGSCPDCNAIAGLSHQNLTIVGPTDADGEPDVAGLIRISQVRDILSTLNFRVERGKKVVIIDCAERFMPQAANAFLKTLEEPPPDSVIILVTARPADLLPTILSRCQRINFAPLDVESVAGYLMEVSGLTLSAASVIARLSAGSIGRALSYVDSSALDDRAAIIRSFSAIKAGDNDTALRLAEDLSKRDDLVEMLEFLKIWQRDIAIAAQGGQGLMVNSDLKMLVLGAKTDIFALYDAYRAIDAAITDIMPPRYSNKLLTLEALFLQLARLSGLRAA